MSADESLVAPLFQAEDYLGRTVDLRDYGETSSVALVFNRGFF